MKVVYSFNKKGHEAEFWTREIARASSEDCKFIPFNHDSYLSTERYIRAQLLDNLYFAGDRDLLRLYYDVERLVGETEADALVVDNCPPYHPEFLRRLGIYKVLRTSDGPMTAYDRDFAYLHAYDHVLYHSPAYSVDLSMAEKLRYCRAKRADFWPLALFEAAYDPCRSLDELLSQPRDVDVVFVGAFHLGKMADLARLKKHFKSRIRMYGLITLKRNVYYNAKFGFPGWVRPLPSNRYVPLYQRSKIGVNIHNRGKYTLGNYRMFELPANGVLQISDGDDCLPYFFEEGKEIVGYRDMTDLIEKTEYYLSHENERIELVANAYRAVLGRHRFSDRMAQLASIIRDGMKAASLGNAGLPGVVSG